ncbi:MAG: PEP-CTERM sorting domain-containing protein [Armatimonadetes bacterium]|nr:PEP-CTERM sorting domain-containing protein [Armatimonadota bacterium]
MRVIKRWAVVAAVCIIATVAQARTDQNSFLNKPAESLQALISQVDQDPQVASRYMRHFGMTKQQVLDKFATLKQARLQKDGTYLVYNVPSWEEVRARAIMFKKGTLVYVDQEGSPVLKASCGNPMTRGTDIGSASASPAVQAAPIATVRDLVAQAETSPIQMPLTSLAPDTPGLVPAEMAATPPATPRMQNISLPAILPLTAGLLLAVGHGSTQTVPEPCTMAVLAIGAAGIAVAKRRKR